MTTVATESLEARSSEWQSRALAAQRACRAVHLSNEARVHETGVTSNGVEETATLFDQSFT